MNAKNRSIIPAVASPNGCLYHSLFVANPRRLIGIVYLSLNDPHRTHLVLDRANCM
ncbi:hypothetical protein L873DRAFT_1805030 [Choiromyces venosus 120613-1]|uniref:Uncharacterized protein n=1 Tax=Choiromyces venosus 120613-1 TaxID=1336337 RepID=A0A3N4JQV8_9PEZI|nr:hypothetical protein L873DRAFT_1805030 [Choiromyces venosus 120613-1]